MVPGDNTQVVLAEGVMNAVEEPLALCIVRDMTSTQQTTKIIFNLPASTTGQQLLEDVSSKCHYEVNSFELVLQRMVDKDMVVINDLAGHTLAEIGFRLGGNARNNLIIGDKNGHPPRRIKVVEDNSVNMDDLQLGASASPVGRSDYGLPAPLPPPLPSFTSSTYSPVSEYSSYNHSSAFIKQETGYVGLVNQAMTCYLNSLLQTLYMSPEFRNALYRWEFDGTAEEEGAKSIPYQLQKLFLQLQTSKRHAIETTDLTKSFGWDSSEAWQQHDVQELCRVMFDALEQKFHKTDQADLINRLYQGKLKDYVKCQECGYESAREDTYLDIPLPVKPFGSSQAFASVEEALQAFVQPEVLDGTNQYFCEKCNKKCDAHKGLKFTTFPYLLTLQLKRFDFDYTTMHRIKLNDKVTFPEILNLNTFIKSESELMHTPDANDDASTTDSGSALDDDTICTQSTHSGSITQNSDNQEDDEGIDVGSANGSVHNNQEVSTNEKNVQHLMEKGPFVYELFSIMVHSGSANGGHYYAYIKSFKDGQWYCFNDQSVSRITYDDIRNTYGGGPARSYYSGMYSSSTNAYMLMYRQIDKERNCDTISIDEVPEHIKKLLCNMEQQEEKEQQQRELERNMCKIKLFWNHQLTNSLLEGRLKLHKDTTLAEAVETARRITGSTSTPVEQCRLVKYDDTHDSLECSFEEGDDALIGDLLGGAKSSYKFSLMFEVRPPDKPFRFYKPGGTTVKIYIVNLETEDIEGPHIVRAYLTQTVEEFKQLVAQELSLPSSEMKMVLERYYNDLRPLTHPTKTLKNEGFYRSNKVFVALCETGKKGKNVSQETFHRILDRYEYTISLRVVLPEVDQDTLNRLSIVINSQRDNGSKSPNNSSIERLLDVGEENSLSLSMCSPIKQESGCLLTSPEGDDGSSSRDYDEGIGDSECDAQMQSGPGVNSDQSEDSSLTDSDRTIVGDVSPQNQSGPFELAPKFTDSLNCSNSNSPQESCEDDRNLSSPEENAKDFKSYNEDPEDWEDATEEGKEHRKEFKRYFRATPYNDIITKAKMLIVHVDKRITLGAFKACLEPHVGVPADYFKVYRLYPNNQEYECIQLHENLTSYSDESQIIIKLGRAPRKGEYRVKIFQLKINEPEVFKFLMDWIFAKGMTVSQAKQEIIAELKTKFGLDIPLNRCRLRKKNWRTPATIYLDHQVFVTDIPLFDNWEVYLEALAEPERLKSTTQLSLYCRRYYPSKLELDAFQEIVLENSTVAQLKEQLTSISKIPVDNIDFAKGQGSFPCEMPILNLYTELEWNPKVTKLNEWPLYICDDGIVIYYKDNQEELKQLSEDGRREIINKENVRLHKIGRTGYSPRKERALKIHTDLTPITTNRKTNDDDEI